MALKEFATIDVGYPILGAKFINNKTVLVTGGGGEGNNGIPNKITAVKCSFKVADPKRRLQKFREVQLPSNEDSPQCIDAVRLDDNEFDVIVGCNQSSQLIRSMSINNNVRKYTYNKNEHLTFIDAAQFEPEISGDAEEYPKIIRIAQDNSIGCLMTSRTPSVLYLFNPEYLELKYKYQPTDSSEIKDFALSPNNGEVLSLITATSIVTFSTQTNSVTFTSRSSLALNKQLGNFTLSKVKYISNYELLISASYKNGKGAVLLRYNLTSQKITQQQLISKKFNNVVGMDLSVNQDLVAVAGNDLSVTLIKLSSFKILQTFNKLHPFAITSVTFSPNGSKLATGSAANTLHVIRIPANYSSGKSIIGTLFQYLFTIVLILALGIGIQKGR
ncbi:WD40 repeat domain-containing protein, partial [Acetobacter pasteurianus]|nr:WD40 repeat domain-containing protein [Acetobacter pasteurianus]